MRPTSITTDMFNYSYKLDMDRKLELFASRGFRFIHWCDDWNNGVVYSSEEMRAHLQTVESFGLKCLDVHGSDAPGVKIGSDDVSARRKYIRLLENRIEFCSALGGDAVVVHPPREVSGLDRSMQVLESVRPLCEDMGVVLAIENCLPADTELLALYFERFPPEFIGFCFDSGHANLNKDADELMGFGGRLRVLHLHDNKGAADDHQPPYYGTVDWQRVMRWVDDCGYPKPVNFEITHRPKYFEGTPEAYLDHAVDSIIRAVSGGEGSRHPSVRKDGHGGR
ncbi:MAG: sugar phosphate isomerase/epimerase [Thermoplasmata archaeon]|jgi:sugar phosphate isomerase/epimerase|nr:sugar phosphate isomerase/epimerase [Thermoplasmata archaeon]